MLVRVEYFTKFVEAEVVAKITVEMVCCSIGKILFAKFWLPNTNYSNNGTLFARANVLELCKNLGIHIMFISIDHPQENGHVESSHQFIISDMRKKLDEERTLGRAPSLGNLYPKKKLFTILNKNSLYIL